MFQTILAGESDDIKQDVIHPQLVVKIRSQTLENLQDKISYEMNVINNLDLLFSSFSSQIIRRLPVIVKF